MRTVLRRNILVDLGETIDQLGAKLIITPDKYKRLDNIGIIKRVADGCKMLSKDDVGKKCILSTWNREDSRFNPTQSKKMGLEAHWHFIIPEDKVEALLE